MAAERQRARHAKAGGQETRRMERKSQSGRQHLLRRTGTCRRKLAGRIRTDTRPAPSPRPGHHDHVCGSRSAPVQRRQRPYGAARHELHVEPARYEPNHYSDGLPGRLPAAFKGAEPQPHRRTAHQCLEPRAALVRRLRLFVAASAIARIARALQRLSRGSAQLQIALSARQTGRLSLSTRAFNADTLQTHRHRRMCAAVIEQPRLTASSSDTSGLLVNDENWDDLSGETPYEFLSHDVQVGSLYEWLSAHRQWRVARAGYERRFPPGRRCSQNIPRVTGDKAQVRRRQAEINLNLLIFLTVRVVSMCRVFV